MWRLRRTTIPPTTPRLPDLWQHTQQNFPPHTDPFSPTRALLRCTVAWQLTACETLTIHHRRTRRTRTALFISEHHNLFLCNRLHAISHDPSGLAITQPSPTSARAMQGLCMRRVGGTEVSLFLLDHHRLHMLTVRRTACCDFHRIRSYLLGCYFVTDVDNLEVALLAKPPNKSRDAIIYRLLQ